MLICRKSNSSVKGAEEEKLLKNGERLYKMRNRYKMVTLKERLDLKNEFSRLHSIGWVKFMREILSEQSTGGSYSLIFLSFNFSF